MSAAYHTRACAHRGDNYCAPENTVPAFVLALEKQAAQIEFDVRVTADEQLVVIHDDSVDRTTNGTGKVGDLTLAQLRELDAGAGRGEAYAGTKLPTLAEVLAVVTPGTWVNCQTYLAPQYIPLVVRQIQDHDLVAQTFIAGDATQIEVSRRCEPALRVCSLEGQRGPDSDYPDQTIALGAQFIQICGWADCMPEVVAKLHAHDVQVNYFGTEDPALMRRLIEAGVDYVLTDHLDVMHEVMGEYGVGRR